MPVPVGTVRTPMTVTVVTMRLQSVTFRPGGLEGDPRVLDACGRKRDTTVSEGRNAPRMVSVMQS